jgi:hypothetical protein
MCSIQLIDRMSRNNDLIDDKENRLQEAINYYHQQQLEKRFQDNKNLFDKDMRLKWVIESHA